VVVKSDEMRPKLADFANFMDSLQEDRDALRLEVGELKETVDDLRSNVERLEEETGDNEQLKKDAAYYKEDAAAKKLKADDMEMDNRSKTEEIKALQAGNVKLKSSLERSKNFIEESNEHLNEATRQIEALKGERAAHANHIAVKDREIAMLQNRIIELQADNDSVEHEREQFASKFAELNIQMDGLKVDNRRLQSDVAEVKRNFETLRRFCASIEEEKETFELSSSNLEQEKEALQRSYSTLEQEKETLQRSYTTLEEEKTTIGNLLKEIKDNFQDVIKLDNVGNGVLLSSGKIISLPHVIKSWIENENFDGDITTSVQCYATATMAKVINNPVVCDFLGKIVQGLGLDTKLPYYFRYARNSVDNTDPIVWVNYKLRDQLTLMAKLIHMCREASFDASFQVTVAENHTVTAKSRVIHPLTEIEITITLGIVNSAGHFSKHRIDFVDTPNPMGHAGVTHLLPEGFHIATEV
jgi:predicted  nucleic acid-binding Zn-ribbon protein